MSNKMVISMAEVRSQAGVVGETIRRLTDEPTKARGLKLYGIPRGGIPAAFAVAGKLASEGMDVAVIDNPASADWIIDDIYDSGRTEKRWCARFPDKPFMVLFDKREKQWQHWLVMPWEVGEAGNDASANDIVTRLLEFIGDDPSREGLEETPARVLKAWTEWSTGYGIDPASVLKTFTDGADGVDEWVVVHNIPVVSKCEHHLADIIGVAHVGYIPNGRIVGLSKLARLVDVFGRRLQVQERLTNQIANALVEHLRPKAVGVIVRASHACMSTRGVNIHGSLTTTSAMRGAALDKPETRAEFLQLCSMAETE
jgi:GTP cyclohydrolase I